jgi:hypothetical protein
LASRALTCSKLQVLRTERRQLRLLHDPAEHALVEVVAAEHRVAARGDDLEYAARKLENGEVEGAAAEVVHGVDAFRGVLEAVGDRRRRRLVQEPQDIQARDQAGVLGRLALRLVEVGWHGDHGAADGSLQGELRALPEDPQNFGRNLHRALHAGRGADLHHARSIDEVVGRVLDVRHVLEAAAHEALHRHDGVPGIGGLPCLRRVSNLDLALPDVAHDRRQERPPERVGQHRRAAAAHGGDEGVGRAQIDAHREPLLVRRG